MCPAGRSRLECFVQMTNEAPFSRPHCDPNLPHCPLTETALQSPGSLQIIWRSLRTSRTHELLMTLYIKGTIMYSISVWCFCGNTEQPHCVGVCVFQAWRKTLLLNYMAKAVIVSKHVYFHKRSRDINVSKCIARLCWAAGSFCYTLLQSYMCCLLCIC